MEKTKKSKLNPREIIVLAAVIAFVVSAPAGFLAGCLGWNFYQGISRGEQAISESDAPTIEPDKSVVEVVREASPAVVSVIVSKDLPVIEQYYEEYNPFGDDELLRNFFGSDFFAPFLIPRYRENGTEKKEIGGGTGFIVSSLPAGGALILTNKHVVSDIEAEYTVLTNDGEKLPAQVLLRDPDNDIAVLKIDKTDLPVIELGDSDKIEIGQTVIAIGNALGEFRNTVSVGVVSGLRRTITASDSSGQTEELAEVIQTDAAVNPGNSGGPLLDLKGRAIGINVAIVQGAENIGFSLPINSVKKDLEQVKAGN